MLHHKLPRILEVFHKVTINFFIAQVDPALERRGSRYSSSKFRRLRTDPGPAWHIQGIRKHTGMWNQSLIFVFGKVDPEITAGLWRVALVTCIEKQQHYNQQQGYASFLFICLFADAYPDPFDTFQVDRNYFKNIVAKDRFFIFFRNLSFEFKYQACQGI